MRKKKQQRALGKKILLVPSNCVFPLLARGIKTRIFFISQAKKENAALFAQVAAETLGGSEAEWQFNSLCFPPPLSPA